MLQSSGIATSFQKNRLSGISGSQNPPNGNLSGEDLARLFKYYRQLKDPGRNFSVPAMNRISARSFYNEHRRAFDKTAEFFSTHNVDARPYIKFFVDELCKTGRDIDEWLFSKRSISEYITKLQSAEKKKKIWSWFQKSVSNIVDMCIEGDYMSGKDCMLALIKSRKIAQEFMTGRISRYFFAAMPNFKAVIPRLDHFARCEFADLYDKFDIYNTEINDVFLTYRNRTVNPLSIVDNELSGRRMKEKPKANAKDSNGLFDPAL